MTGTNPDSSLLAGPRYASGAPLAFLVFALIAGHTMSSMAVLVLPAVAPAVAREYGFDPSLIGYQTSLVGIGMAGTLTLLANLSRRLGACRANQAGHGLVATGMLILLVPWTPFLILGSLVVGAGYGMLTPAASYLLVRFTPLALDRWGSGLAFCASELLSAESMRPSAFR